MSEDGPIERLVADKPIKDEVRIKYLLAMRDDREPNSWLRSYWDAPWWLPQDRAREAAVAMRDSLRSLGFDVTLVQETKLEDVIP
jgi:hypothetical protein